MSDLEKKLEAYSLMRILPAEGAKVGDITRQELRDAELGTWVAPCGAPVPPWGGSWWVRGGILAHFRSETVPKPTPRRYFQLLIDFNRFCNKYQ